MTEPPFETTVPVRYQDLDALGHVNNAVYATYLEQARIDFFADALDLDAGEVNTVVAHLELDFDAPIVDAPRVTVTVQPTHLGEKSFTLAYEIRAAGEVAARGESVQVWIDPETGASREIPGSLRAELDRFVASTAD